MQFWNDLFTSIKYNKYQKIGKPNILKVSWSKTIKVPSRKNGVG